MEYIIDSQTVFVTIIVFIITSIYLTSQLPKDFPKGPRPLPVVGNLLLMLGDPHDVQRKFLNLSKKYGPIVGLKLGNVPTVLLNDLDSIKVVLVKHGDSFSARPQYLYMITEAARNPPHEPVRGVIWTSGETWKQSRRFTLSAMKDFGVGKNTIEYKIQEEAVALCTQLACSPGEPCKPRKLLQSSVSNIICGICFGSRFEYSDPDFNRLLSLLNETFECDLFKCINNFFPFFRFLPKQEVFRKTMNTTRQINQWIEKEIQKHSETYDPDNIKDFVDLYLSNTNSDKTGLHSPYNMYKIIFELFTVGTETTSTALRWFLLYMIHFPKIQSKVQKEIDSVIGQARLSKLEDRKKMVYLDAVLHETLRVSNIAGLALPHSSSQDVTVGGYKIPKNTLVFPNTGAVHMDPKLWDEPEEFRPERWIGSDGKLIKQKEGFMPFSAGPRICLGESLAWNQMFLFTATLMQRFKVRMSDPGNPLPLQGTIGATHAPVDYEIIFEMR